MGNPRRQVEREVRAARSRRATPTNGANWNGTLNWSSRSRGITRPSATMNGILPDSRDGYFPCVNFAIDEKAFPRSSATVAKA